MRRSKFLPENFRSDFFQKVSGTFLTRLLLIGVAFVTSVIVTRILGPGGRGLFAVAMALGNMGAQFGNLGLHASNVYYVSQDRKLLGPLTGNSLLVGFGFGSLVAFGVGFLFFFFPDKAPVQGWILRMGLLWIPVSLAYILLQNLLLGIQEIKVFNVIDLAGKILALILIGGLFFSNRASVENLLGVSLLAVLGTIVAIIARLWVNIERVPLPSFSLFQKNIRYGMKAYWTALFSFLVLKVDLLMVQYIKGAEPAGYYSIASQMADMVLMLPSVIGMILFPKLSAMKDEAEKWDFAWRSALWTGLFLLLLCGTSALFAPWFIPFFYGRSFTLAVGSFIWLLPGIFFLGVETVAVQFLNSVGFPQRVVWAWAAVLGLNVFLNLWMIPRLGIVGASIDSSICYFLIFCFIFSIILKHRKKGANEAVLVIWRSVPITSPGAKAPEDRALVSITFDELIGSLKTSSFLKYLFRYQEVILKVHDLDLISRPFTTGVLLWLLAWRRSLIQDEKGRELKIDLFQVCSLLVKRSTDWMKIKSLLRETEMEVDGLQAEKKAEKTLDFSKRPIYLRTDLTFGLKSGGSVGHIAGVLNNLEKFTKPPIFLTTDPIPTVQDSVEAHWIVPARFFWDFKEELTLAFNRRFFEWALELLKSKPVSFIYQRYSLNNYSGLKLADQFWVPFVLEFNGSEIWVGRQWDGRLKRETLSEKIEKLNLGKADLIVVVSQALKASLVQQGVAVPKILVNPNGVEANNYSPAVDGLPVRRKFGLESKLVVGFIGLFGKWHGTEILAEAFGKLLNENTSYRESVRLLLIGNGGMMPRVKEVLKNHGVEECSILTGTIPQQEGPAYLAACDILVSPTVPNPDGTPFFGSPTKLFEYMAMGKGIIASDLDQIGEVLKHDETAWLVKPGDTSALAEGLKKLIEDPARRKRLGEAARKDVVAKYTWQEHTRKIIEKLKERCS